MHPKIWSIILCFSLALSSLVGCGGGKQVNMPADEKEASPKTTPSNPKWTLAVFPFDIAGKSKITGVDVANLITGDLIDLQGVKIVEREELGNVLRELGLKESDLADPSTRIAVGRLLGAQLLCFGNINKKINLITARVIQTETSEILFVPKAPYNNEVKGVEAIAQLLRTGLESHLSIASNEPDKQSIPEQTVEVTGRGTIIDGDVISAKELALKDAYAKAIAQGAGVKLIRETQVENFQLVRDKILTESVGYVTNYEIVKETQNPPLYEVAVRASVSKQPLSEVEKLPIMVKYLFAKPRIAVLIDGSAKGEPLPESRVNVIQGQISSRLQQAGFSVVDVQTIEEKKKEFTDTLSNEDAARLSSQLEAEVIIRGSLSTDITTRTEELDGKKLNFPIMGATTTGTFRVIRADTADIIYAFSHEDLSQKAVQKGYGTTDEAAIGKSIDNFIKASTDQLIWGLVAKLGDPIQMQLELQDATLAQAQQFQRQISEMPKQVVLASEMLDYQEGIANYQIKTPSKRIFQRKLQMLDPTKFGAKAFNLDTSQFRTIVVSLKT